ncbi:hypothetical protein [Methylobacterium fujisawaense]
MFDPDDLPGYLPGYLRDAYGAAFDNGLQQLNLTRIGGGENKMWQCSSRFTRSAGFHVEIEADPFDAIMKALGAWSRIGAPSPTGFFDDEPAPEGASLFD